jgi:hypothetical protein
MVLQLADAGRSVVDTTLGLVHAGLSVIALGAGVEVGIGGPIELLLHSVEFLKSSVRLGLLLSGRDGESRSRGQRGQAQRDAESRSAADESASAKRACMLTHIV